LPGSGKILVFMKHKLLFTEEQKVLRRKIITLINEVNTSHIGSALTAIDLIDGIYKQKKKDDIFVLSYGHAATAWYVVLEKQGLMKNPSLKKLAVHPDRDIKSGIAVSAGSLGQGLPIAIGMALAEKKRKVYCLISDGECSEGSVWEALRLAADLKVINLIIILAANGYGAYDAINLVKLLKRIRSFGLKVITIDGHNPKKIEQALKTKPKSKPILIFARCLSEQLPFLKGIHAHYHVMSKEDYLLGMEKLQ